VTRIRGKSISTAAALLFTTAISVQAYRAPENATAAEIRQLDGCLSTYGLEFQRYPSQSEGLSALVTGPTNIQNTNFSGYIREIPKDSWGRAYVYRFPALHNTNGPDLYSLGEDGVSKSGGNDPDDINNWNWDQRPWSRYYARRYTQQRLLDHAYYWGIGCAVVAGYIYVFWRNRLRKRSTSPSPPAS